MFSSTVDAENVSRPPAERLLERFLEVRSFTEAICEPLETEDYVIQSMPDVSPTRWHLAHTTWFFETFLLYPNDPGYQSPDESFAYLFNSYYNSVGKQFPREQRGLLSRPTVEQVWRYRRDVDRAVSHWIQRETPTEEVLAVMELGLQHEQQHQELMLTDIKHVLSCNPLQPAYRMEALSAAALAQPGEPGPAKWVDFEQQLAEIGRHGDGFCFDNETPRHRVFLEPYRLRDRLVTNAEYLEFIHDGGYDRPELWLSLGWSTVVEQGWQAPLYWRAIDSKWEEFTLDGLRPLDGSQPVCHVSYFEADAFARWSGKRLPTESEWECAVRDVPVGGNLAESWRLHPAPAVGTDAGRLRQCYGDVWEWTSSPYAAYPGYRATTGALGEYNGKFMCNQFVLRGGSCVTAQSHVRASYRNFFPPAARWQFAGIRLAE